MSHKKIAPFDLRESWVISDSHDFLQHCRAQGFNTKPLSKITILPERSIIFSFCDEAARRTFEVAKNTPIKQSIFCATHVFDPSVDSALYGLSLIMKSHFFEALQKQRTVLTLLDTYKQFSLIGPDSEAHVTIAQQSTPYAMIEEDIEHAFIHSVAEFFEVHYAHMNAQMPCPFQFTGHLSIAGILTVRRKHPEPPDLELKMALEQLIQEVAYHTATLTVDSNTVTSFIVNNTERVTLLKRAAGARQLKLTEFAVGVNDAIATSIDYRINSQMNEGISGVHVALGDGSSGYHIDFLSPGVLVTPCVRHPDSGAAT